MYPISKHILTIISRYGTVVGNPILFELVLFKICSTSCFGDKKIALKATTYLVIKIYYQFLSHLLLTKSNWGIHLYVEMLGNKCRVWFNLMLRKASDSNYCTFLSLTRPNKKNLNVFYCSFMEQSSTYNTPLFSMVNLFQLII